MYYILEAAYGRLVLLLGKVGRSTCPDEHYNLLGKLISNRFVIEKNLKVASLLY
jgi:hypothetical protein